MISITDLIKGKFLEEFSAISVSEMLIAIGLSFVLGLFILYIYRVTFTGVSLNRGFADSLLMLSTVTTVVILVITSNVVLSLGMVGALSIVRFRTAVKEPRDTTFMFWAIATGIICGAGYVTIAVLSCLLLGLLFVAVHAISGKKKANGYMIVARFDKSSNAEASLKALPGYTLKTLTMSGDFTELVAEARLGNQGMAAIAKLREMPGVHEITVMSSVSNSVL